MEFNSRGLTRFVRHALVAAALALSSAPAWGAGVLVPLSAADASLIPHSAISPLPSAGGRFRDGPHLVRVDHRRLFQTIHGAAEHGTGRLILNVADGVEFNVVVERTKRTLSGHSLSGRLDGVAGSAVTLVAHAEVVMGTVWTPDASYEIVPVKDGVHAFREVDMSARPPLGEPVRAEGGWDALPPVEQAEAEGGSVVDVLVVYTPKALENAGGEAQVRAGIDLAIAWANDAYERSGAEVRLNLVGAEPVDYVEQDAGCVGLGCRSGTDLGRLANPSDGFMDGAHGRRDALGADLVSLFTGDGDVGGIAGLPGAFSVVNAYYENWSSYENWASHGSYYGVGSTFAHELGHNMGLSHDRHQVLGLGREGLLPFSYGYVNQLAFEPDGERKDCWFTIMAYEDRCSQAVHLGGWTGDKVPYFSTPDRRYPDDEGVPLGVPKSSDEEGADGPADAVRSLNMMYRRVVNLRPGRADDGDTAETATPVTATSTTLARLTDAADVDYFRIELPEAGWMHVESTSEWGGHLVTLTKDDGAMIVLPIGERLEAGVYFIKVEHAPGEWQPFDYTLSVSFNPASVADDHGDGAAKATVAALPSSMAGELQNPSDIDYFRFELAERGLVRMGTAGATDVVGTLTSEDGTLRVTNDDGGPSVNFLIAAKLNPGVYFVAVRGFDGGAVGPYSLDISFSPLSEVPDDHADDLDGATDLALESPVSGELEVFLDQDHFRIEVPGAGPGQLWVKSTGGTDVKGVLLSRNGGSLNERRHGGDYPNFVVGAQVAPGTYILRVAGASAADAGRYAVEVSFIADNRTIPLFISASHPKRQGFARIINRSDRSGVVAIHAIDDAGKRHAPVTLSLAAGQTRHFNSEDLEKGNAEKGLSAGLGAGEGDWRLELATDLDIEALAYVRTDDGFLTGMHGATTNQRLHHWAETALTFNPASNRRQVSKLRLINQGPGSAHPFVYGTDDSGEFASSSVGLYLAAGASRTVTAQQLETGGDGLQGRLGDGAGKWRLSVSAPVPIRAMSLLESPTGHLTNLSGLSAPIGREASLPLIISASNSGQQGFARIINRNQQRAEVAIHAIDDAGRRHGPVTLALAAYQTTHLNSDDLEMGNADKGLSGGLGAGEGDWRLELVADLEIQTLAYVRTADGFLTGMNALAPTADGRHEVVFFNPASNDRQVSKLRLINPADAPATITISGVDDAGAAPPDGEVTLTVPAGAAAEITAQQLEAGADHFEGRFGDGKGKWRLFVEADQDIQAMSLLESPTGHITNLSSGTAVR